MNRKVELEENIFNKLLKQRWKKANDLPKFFGVDMIVVDFRRNHAHITLERYDEYLKEWFGNHPTAIWCCIYDVLPNFDGSF